MIIVVALGCAKGQLTIAGAEAIDKAEKVFVKTALTDTYEYFKDKGIDCTTLDFIYEKSQNFDELDEEIANYLLSQKGDIVYCVNGSGYEDRSVALLSQKCEVKILPSASFGIAGGKPSTANTVISAYDIVSMKGFNYDTRTSLCVSDIDNAFIASEVKLVLQNILGDEESAYFNGKQICIYELDRQGEYNYATTLYIPPKNLVDKTRFNFADLYQIMRILRGENGCQWDKAQTHESIRQNAVEEAYELVEAINNDDIDNIIEESGDLFLQSIFHCVIAEDCGEFCLEDCLSGICRKLIDRHTHIFGDVVANTPEEALKAWDNAKAKEKKYTSASDKIDKIAAALPALMKAYKIQKAAGKVGFEFDEFGQVVGKIREEVDEFCNAKTADELEDEGGDILFAAVNALRWKNVEPEIALSRAIDKFVKRFKYVEEKCDGDMKDKSLDELIRLWEEAKVATKN
ncbi:MAG: nucleoside triphosphate pyrophosphohydrolase [Clostridia bacterium]|nr:nucleoside triphosphate pyrophosphohydrolase [Clostridia bacterium]